MRFLHNDLGQLDDGQVIEVTLSSAANVRLLDNGNFSSYRGGGRHNYFGGYVTRSPYRLAVPHSGYWHLAIDLGGYAGSVRAGVRVLS